ncbi:hypothetical protein FA15DRAFT_667489 [Coprinopsis marcescibilis]|uniref:Uncharacterized protein n=1 Tax=Coprinopsis marcescibilis TaxID=230819 RepID=A0A5C3L0U6_COPMA|nr:hypothetical protein FA15DRAFT_667489 [Coprinopsis marcescibilis]
MSSTFTPSNAIDLSKEKQWAGDIGLLDWDSTSIVFTKRSLIEFLKYTGTTVDTNFGNISKLPKYAKFGKLSAEIPIASAQQQPESNAAAEQDAFKPSRRVRTAPGGDHTDIFAADDEGALAAAPPAPADRKPPPPAPQPVYEDPEHQGIAFTSSVKPSRRVREQPGGKDSLSNIFGGPGDEPEFKPTRRVRDAPGGRDNISGLF